MAGLERVSVVRDQADVNGVSEDVGDGLLCERAFLPGADAALVQRMCDQAQRYGAQFQTMAVTGSALSGDPKRIIIETGETLLARVVILATGAMAHPQTIPGEEEFLGNGVSYSAICDGVFFKGRDVFVYGSTEKAVNEALVLARFTPTVFPTSPKPIVDIGRGLQNRVEEAKGVTVLTKTRLKAIEGNQSVTHVTLLTLSGEKQLPAEGVFLFTQSVRPIVDYAQGQIELTPEGCVRVDQEMATSAPGVFACGDLFYAGIQQAVVVAAQGCTAALAADQYLHRRPTFSKDHR